MQFWKNLNFGNVSVSACSWSSKQQMKASCKLGKAISMQQVLYYGCKNCKNMQYAMLLNYFKPGKQAYNEDHGLIRKSC